MKSISMLLVIFILLNNGIVFAEEFPIRKLNTDKVISSTKFPGNLILGLGYFYNGIPSQGIFDLGSEFMALGWFKIAVDSYNKGIEAGNPESAYEAFGVFALTGYLTYKLIKASSYNRMEKYVLHWNEKVDKRDYNYFKKFAKAKASVSNLTVSITLCAGAAYLTYGLTYYLYAMLSFGATDSSLNWLRDDMILLFMPLYVGGAISSIFRYFEGRSMLKSLEKHEEIKISNSGVAPIITQYYSGIVIYKRF